jgi:hypothetical protein
MGLPRPAELHMPQYTHQSFYTAAGIPTQYILLLAYVDFCNSNDGPFMPLLLLIVKRAIQVLIFDISYLVYSVTFIV